MNDKNKTLEQLESEFDALYDTILDGLEDWDYSDLNRLLELHLKINTEFTNI